jgi:RNA polymerase sigma factor (sigma-70 family)
MNATMPPRHYLPAPMNQHATIEDAELLRQFFRTRDEPLLRALMDRHLPLVYSVALRISGSPELAAEAAQDVFLKLTRSNELLMTRGIPFMAWLHRSARHRAIDLLRSEQARKNRERLAAEAAIHSQDELSGEALALLDEVIEELPIRDRELVLERFFAKRSLAAIGARAGLSEDAVRMRLSRVLEKMRTLFSGRGISTTAAMLATTLPLRAIVQPPSHLASGIKVKVVTGSAGAGVTGPTLPFLTLMSSAQKAALAAALIAVVAISGGIYLVSSRPASTVAGSPAESSAGGRASSHATAALGPVSTRGEKERIELVKKWLMDTSPEERDSHQRLQQTIGLLSADAVRELLAERGLFENVQGPEREDEFPNPVYPRRWNVECLLWRHLGKITPEEALQYLVAIDAPAGGVLENASSVLPGVAKSDPALVLRFLRNPPAELPEMGLGGCFDELLPLLVEHSREGAFEMIHHLTPMDRKEWYLGYVHSLGPETDWDAEVDRLNRELPGFAELGFRMEGVAGHMAGEWARSDPESAFAWIATDQANATAGYFDAIRIWLLKEPSEGFQWLKTWNPAGIDRNAVYSNVLIYGGAGDLAVVDGLLELIPDPAARTTAVKKAMKNMGRGIETEVLLHLKGSPLLSDEAWQAVEDTIAAKEATAEKK